MIYPQIFLLFKAFSPDFDLSQCNYCYNGRLHLKMLPRMSFLSALRVCFRGSLVVCNSAYRKLCDANIRPVR